MIFIVIPVFNRKEFTKSCLISLRNQTNKNFKTIVVDDGSTDGTGKMLEEEFDEVVVLKGTGNLFWTASVNLGIKYGLEQGATHLMTLNNDLTTAPDFIENMCRAIEKEPEAVIGSFELDAMDKTPIYGGERIKWLTATYVSLLSIKDKSELVGMESVTHLPGRGMLIPRKVFDTIGLFAEKKLPHYIADYDYTHRAYKHGFPVIINYEAKIYTYPNESGDVKNRQKKSIKNYYKHLFSIRGGGNLIDFTKYAFRNCPLRHLPFFLISGYLRRIIGYFIK